MRQEGRSIMPIIYLSPSTQEWNMYVTGSGSEEYNMKLLADALVPYLLSNGIQYKRNQPDMTAGSSVRDANTGYYDLYLALHSNASPEGRYGENRGIIAFYYPGSTQGQRAAELIVEELRDIYNYADAVWLEGHWDAIAQQLARALTRFFGLPFIYPMDPVTGTVSLSYGTLNLRSYPSSTGTVIASIPNGASVTVYGEWQGWYVVHYRNYVGYAAAAYIDT